MGWMRRALGALLCLSLLLGPIIAQAHHAAAPPSETNASAHHAPAAHAHHGHHAAHRHHHDKAAHADDAPARHQTDCCDGDCLSKSKCCAGCVLALAPAYGLGRVEIDLQAEREARPVIAHVPHILDRPPKPA